MGRKSTWLYVLLGGAIFLAVAYSVGLLLDVPEWINGRYWEWDRQLPDGGGRILWLLAICLVAFLLWLWTERKEDWRRQYTLLLVLWAAVMSPVLQEAVAGQHRSRPWSVIFLHLTTSGFFQDGVEIEDPVEFISEHYDNMRGYRDVHARTQPPGWQIAFWGASRLAERVPSIAEPFGRQLMREDCLSQELREMSPNQAAAAVLSLSILLWSGLGAVPYWRFGRYFLKGRPLHLALIVYPFWPAMLVFSGRFDALYAILALLTLWLGQRTLVKEHWLVSAVIFGGLMAAATWFGLGTLAIVALVDVVLVSQLLLKTVGWQQGIRRLLALNGLFLAALLALWVGLRVAFGLDGLALFALGQELHLDLRITYPVWPLFNMFDLAVFMSVVIFVGAIVGMIGVVWRTAVKGQPARPIDALITGWVVFVVVFNLSGQVRAETGRLWLFLMGPGLLVGVAGWTDWLKGNSRGRALTAALLLVVMGQAMASGLFLGGRAPTTTTPEPVWLVPDGVTAVSFNLGDTIALEGYSFEEGLTQTELTLYWQALDYLSEAYVVFAHQIDSAGNLVTQDDGPLQEGGPPTSCWIPGEIIEDTRVFPTVEDTRIGVGFYNWHTGERIVVEPPRENEMIFLPAE